MLFLTLGGILIMFEMGLFSLIGVAWVCLQIALIVLTIKHFKLMYALTEEVRKEQIALSKETLEIKSNLIINQKNLIKNLMNNMCLCKTDDSKNKNTIKKPPIKKETNIQTVKTSETKSSQVSEQELLELIKDKEKIFKKQVTIPPGAMSMDVDIDIENKNNRH